MARMVFSEVVGTMSFLRPQCDDDSVDRLHYYYTTTFLLVVAVLICLKMFGGSPIECWLPAEFKPSWQEYTELICWSMSTYFVRGALAPHGANEPRREPERGSQTVAYYQWTPFFLVFSAIIFYSPCLVWRRLSAKSGLVLNEIVGFAMAVDQCPTAVGGGNFHVRTAKLRGIAAHLGSAFRHRSRRQGSLMIGKFWGEEVRYHQAYLSSLYMAIKLLFLAIVLLQAILMNKFLQTDNYDFYGLGVLRDLLQGRAWSDSGFFPRVTFCDIDIRILGSVQQYTVQCILVINIFTEKVFVLLWLWYSLLLLITLFNGLGWLYAIVSFQARKEFVLRRLQLADMEFDGGKSENKIEQFLRDFLKMDGCFILRMLDVHTGEWVCAEILDLIWEEYCEQLEREGGGGGKGQKEANDMKKENIEGAPSDELPPKKGAPPRRAKKVGLLQPLMARPAQEGDVMDGGYGWASMPNLLWSVPPAAHHRHQAIFSGKFPSRPILPHRHQSKMDPNQQGAKRHALASSSSFDEPSSRHRLVGRRRPLERAATLGLFSPTARIGGAGYGALRKNSDIQEEDEGEETEKSE